MYNNDYILRMIEDLGRVLRQVFLQEEEEMFEIVDEEAAFPKAIFSAIAWAGFSWNGGSTKQRTSCSTRSNLGSPAVLSRGRRPFLRGPSGAVRRGAGGGRFLPGGDRRGAGSPETSLYGSR